MHVRTETELSKIDMQRSIIEKDRKYKKRRGKDFPDLSVFLRMFSHLNSIPTKSRFLEVDKKRNQFTLYSHCFWPKDGFGSHFNAC